jgi:hypothetical protein
MSSELAEIDSQPRAMRGNAMTRSIAPTNIAELAQLANIYFLGGVTPKNCNRPETVAAIIAAGMEVGLKPGQALSSMYMVNGKIVMYGDALLALVRASGQLETITETVDGDGDNRAGTCTVKRVGDKVAVSQRYTVADAKKAGLFMKNGKPGPWDTNPDRMLKFRARNWLLRDVFTDILNGMGVAEDVEEYATSTTSSGAKFEAVATVKTDLPAVTNVAMITEEQRYKIKQYLPDWFRSRDLNPELDQVNCIGQWKAYLSEQFGTDDAKKLTEAQAKTLLDALIEASEKVNPTIGELFTPADATSQPTDTAAVKG